MDTGTGIFIILLWLVTAADFFSLRDRLRDQSDEIAKIRRSLKDISEDLRDIKRELRGKQEDDEAGFLP